MSMDPLDFSKFEADALKALTPKNSINIRFEKGVKIGKPDENGIPKHEEEHIAYLRVPGSRDEFVMRVDEKFFAQHGRASYDKWCETQAQPVDGLALEYWPPIPKSLVEDWKYHGVRSVQQLAGMSDTICQRLGPKAMEFRGKAIAWLEQAKDHATSQRLTDEVAQLKLDNEMLRRQVKELGAKAAGMAPAPAPAVDIAAIVAAVTAQMKNGAAQ